jgi:CO dehydrogenase nickel-insertion accessory protein CooC1
MGAASADFSDRLQGETMTKTIAIAGKGRTGKTTIAALLIKYLVENKKGTVLAIDADPSTNLNLTLGVPLEETVGDIREETLQEVQSGRSLGGMSKPDYLELRVNQALVEEEGIVSDPTTRGLIATARVAELIHELHTHAGQVRLVINRVIGGNGDEPQLAPPLQQIIADNNLQLLGLIPPGPHGGRVRRPGQAPGRTAA